MEFNVSPCAPTDVTFYAASDGIGYIVRPYNSSPYLRLLKLFLTSDSFYSRKPYWKLVYETHHRFCFYKNLDDYFCVLDLRCSFHGGWKQTFRKLVCWKGYHMKKKKACHSNFLSSNFQKRLNCTYKLQGQEAQHCQTVLASKNEKQCSDKLSE